MRRILLFSLFLLPLLAFSQAEYSFDITADTDSTFQLDVIETINASRSTINRTIGLDSSGLQGRLFSEIERLYQQRAQLIVQADQKIREINARKSALDEVGLETYRDSTIVKLDSFFVADYRYRNSTGRVVELYSQYRQGKTTLLREKETDLAFAAITPFSTGNIKLTAIRPEFEDGETSVNIYSANLRFYSGTDNLGIRHLLIRK